VPAPEGVPQGGMWKEFTGHAAGDEARPRADEPLAGAPAQARYSFALYRDVVVEAPEFPYLSVVLWKVLKLPAAGRLARGARDEPGAGRF